MVKRTSIGILPDAWYGTLRECVDELWRRINFTEMKFPDFDFALAQYGETDFETAYENAECWFGVKDFGKKFDSDTISVMIGHYGGGGVEAMEISGEEGEKEKLMKKISNAVEDILGGGISPDDDYVVFEIYEEVIY